MRKTITPILVSLLILGLVTSAIPVYVTSYGASPSNIPASTNPPPSAMSFISPSLTVTFNTTSIVNLTGNITGFTVFGAHYVETTYGTNFDVLSLILSSTRGGATGSAQAFISTGPAAWFSLIQAVRNGSALYRQVNGVVTLNNFFQVSPNELSVKRIGTKFTVDFNPATSTEITLPPDMFPPANFSSKWVVPAFHTEANATGTMKMNPTTTTQYAYGIPKGWTQYSDSAGYTISATLTTPLWNSFTATASGSFSEFQVNRFVNLTPTPFPGGIPDHTFDFYNGGVNAVIDFPAIGNITRMTISALHVSLSDHVPTTDVLSITLTGPLAKGSVNPRISANPYTPPISASTTWIYALVNGTSSYTEVNGNIVTNNIFNNLGTNELKVQTNGTSVTVDFNPAKPITITLDPSTFPPGNFPRTWTLPAFHMDFYGSSGFTVPSIPPSFTPSGWKTQTYLVASSGNATFNCPSWNNYTTTVPAAVAPLFVQTTQAPSAPRPPLDVTARASVTVLPGWTWWFSVQNLGGQPSYTYQWYEGTTLLQGQNQMVLPVTKNTPGVYRYYCVVMDSQGTATTSNAAILTVIG